MPLSANQQQFIKQSREHVRNILEGRDSRTLVILGPCSVHDCEAVEAYAQRMQALAQQNDTLFLVMRTYFEKPRTLHGWKGLLYDPFLDQSHDIASGLHLTRKLLLRLADMRVPCATEFLDPMTHSYFDDLISWGCVGARTVTSQPHRQMASGLPMPVGFKNGVEGDVEVAIHAVKSARAPHAYLGSNLCSTPSVIRTRGNPCAHVILRGGSQGPNYQAKDVARSLARMNELLVDPSVIIDCSHDNSRKDHMQQELVFRSVIEQISAGVTGIKGLMLEGHLLSGNQPLVLDKLKYGVSITDACMGWKETERLIQWTQDQLRETRVTATG